MKWLILSNILSWAPTTPLYGHVARILLIGFFFSSRLEWLDNAEGGSTGYISASGGVLGHDGPGVCLGDGQTEAERVPSQGGRGDALLRRMPPYLTWSDLVIQLHTMWPSRRKTDQWSSNFSWFYYFGDWAFILWSSSLIPTVYVAYMSLWHDFFTRSVILLSWTILWNKCYLYYAYYCLHYSISITNNAAWWSLVCFQSEWRNWVMAYST